MRCKHVVGPLAGLGVPSGLAAASIRYEKTLLSSGFVGTPRVAIFQLGQDLPTKEAQIRREKTKEDSRPFLTISETSQRAKRLETQAIRTRLRLLRVILIGQKETNECLKRSEVS